MKIVSCIVSANKKFFKKVPQNKPSFHIDNNLKIFDLMQHTYLSPIL